MEPLLLNTNYWALFTILLQIRQNIHNNNLQPLILRGFSFSKSRALLNLFLQFTTSCLVTPPSLSPLSNPFPECEL